MTTSLPAAFSTLSPDLVAPGDVIFVRDRDLILVVDQINRTLRGFDFIGWPLHRVGSGRRINATVETSAFVDVLADEHTAERVATIIRQTLAADTSISVLVDELPARLHLEVAAPGSDTVIVPVPLTLPRTPPPTDDE